jgi:hypothetical protein
VSTGSKRIDRILTAERLLGPFEPVLMGWRSRAGVLGTFEPRLVTGGIFRSFGLSRAENARCGCRAPTS